MDEVELVYLVIAVTVVLLATIAAWIEIRMEERDAPDYVRLLRHDSRYREHVARGPVAERRRLGRRKRSGRPPSEAPSPSEAPPPDVNLSQEGAGWQSDDSSVG